MQNGTYGPDLCPEEEEVLIHQKKSHEERSYKNRHELRNPAEALLQSTAVYCLTASLNQSQSDI